MMKEILLVLFQAIKAVIAGMGGLPWWLCNKESTCKCRGHETQVQFLGWEDPLKKEMATCSSNPAWEIPWTEDSGRLQSMESLRVRHDLAAKQHKEGQKAWKTDWMHDLHYKPERTHKPPPVVPENKSADWDLLTTDKWWWWWEQQW